MITVEIFRFDDSGHTSKGYSRIQYLCDKFR